MRSFFYGSTLRLRFSCEFSFTLSSFLGDRFFDSSPTFLVVSAGSEGFLILEGYLVIWSLVHMICT